jgi:hypothetical protein
MLGPAVVVAACLAAEPSQSENLAEILRNVRAGEVQFRDIDIKFEKTYSVGDHVRAAYANAKPADRSEASFTECLLSRKEVHLVSQGDRFRVDIEGFNEMANGKRDSSDLIRAWDGKATRELQRREQYLEMPHRVDQYARFRPHVFQFHFAEQLTLAELLQYGEHYGDRTYRPEKHQVEYEASELVDGIPCVRVMVTNSSGPGEWYNRWQLWLATERHYIPCKVLAWTRRRSETVPMAEQRVTRWMELEEGIWLPAAAETKTLDMELLGEKGIKKVRWTESYKIRGASLKPRYEESYFSTIPKRMP